MTAVLPWVIFNAAILALLAVDLGVVNRRAHVISFREATLWSVLWVVLSLGFNAYIYFWRGSDSALEFLTGYVLEKSLSLDNVFVFAVIFAAMGVAAEFQHKVLFWGVVGALVTRGLFIFVGVELVSRFTWILDVFGLFLIVTGVKLLLQKRREIRPERSLVLRLARQFLPITAQFEGAAFFVRRTGQVFSTPLLWVLVLVEATDVLFAADSIPAIFAVTQDPFIIYTSNVCAILGLRAMYFMLASAISRFRYLRAGLSSILVFVGGKMLIVHFYKIPTFVSLVIICLILMITILGSLLMQNKKAGKGTLPEPSSSSRR